MCRVKYRESVVRQNIVVVPKQNTENQLQYKIQQWFQSKIQISHCGAQSAVWLKVSRSRETDQLDHSRFARAGGTGGKKSRRKRRKRREGGTAGVGQE